MQNLQIRPKYAQKPIITRSTEVGFRVSHDQLQKLKETQSKLKMFGFSGTISDSLRIILDQFNLNLWKSDVEQTLSKGFQ